MQKAFSKFKRYIKKTVNQNLKSHLCGQRKQQPISFIDNNVRGVKYRKK